jgi:hypothetical protein
VKRNPVKSSTCKIDFNFEKAQTVGTDELHRYDGIEDREPPNLKMLWCYSLQKMSVVMSGKGLLQIK